MDQELPAAYNQITEEQYADYLRLETEHFYRAEIHCEQRASWLLSIAFGALAVAINVFGSPLLGKGGSGSAILLLIAAALLFCAMLVALFALWPLKGRRAALYGFRSAAPMEIKIPMMSALDLGIQHYVAHRWRAERKSVRVAWAALLLSIGLIAFVFAVLQIGAGLAVF